MLAAVVLAVFPKVALGLTTFFFRDSGALGYPGAVYFQQSLLHGELPLWNPYSHCGVPLLAQMGSWYPASFLCALLPLPWSMNFFLLAHLVLGGAGMYALARRWGAAGFAASFAGFAFVFNGVTLSCFQWSNYIASLGWLPWVVLAVTAAWRHGGRWLAIAAVVSALQVLTATPELTLLVWLFLAALWLAELFSRKIKFWISARRSAVVIALAAGITMIQMLPFFDLLAHSQRDTNYDNHSRWAMPGWGWANLVVPLFHNYLSPQGNWFQHDQDFLMSYYPGLGVLTLALAGVWLVRTRTSLVIAATILCCWALALGEAGHLYPLAKKVFPWIGIARFPVKFTTLAAFLVPLLAAWAVQKIQTNADARTRRSVIFIGGIFIALAAGLVFFARQNPFPYDEINAMTTNAIVRVILLLALLAALLSLAKIKTAHTKTLVQFAALGILLADLLTHSPGIVPTLPSSVLAPGLWQAQGKPAPALGFGRIMDSPQAEQQMLFSYVRDPQLDFLGHRLAEWYNLNLLDSLPKVNGAFTLRPAQFDLVEQRIYYTSGASYGEGFSDFVSAAWISDPANPAKWLARTNYLPVLTAGQKPEFKTDLQSLDAITAKNFNPRTEVFLPESARASITVSNQTRCDVSHVRFGQNQIAAEVNATEPSLVVLSQTYYHLWRAEVDGARVPLLRANVAFQALQVPAGKHEIKLIYRDNNLLVGAAISIFSILICVVLWKRQPPLEKLDHTNQAN
ncbi:MAG TPA: YfhO family protein [Verrucomicrobiae bacterium]